MNIDNSLQTKLGIGSILLALMTTGFAFIIYEILFLREMLITLGGTVYASSTTLAGVMCGLFLGSQLFGYWTLRSRKVARLFVFIEFALFLTSLYSVPALRFLGTLDSWALKNFLSFLIVMLPSVLMGGEIPVAMQFISLFVSKKKIGFHSGLVYGADTLGALIGALAVPFFLLPWLGSYSSTLLAGAANGLSALIMLPWVLKASPLSVSLLALIFTVLSLAWGGARERIDRSTLFLSSAPGSFLKPPPAKHHRNWDSPYQRIQVIPSSHPPRPGSHILLLNGTPQSGTHNTRAYAEMIAFPLLCHPNPKRVLIIGCGDGDLLVTALADPRVQELHQVEIDPRVIEVSRKHLPKVNHRKGRSVWEDPRVVLKIGDGRRFLEETELTFDLIYCDLPHVLADGADAFYSRDFFDLARARLNKGGVFMTHAYSRRVSGERSTKALAHWAAAGKNLESAFKKEKTIYLSTVMWPERMEEGDDLYVPSLMGFRDEFNVSKRNLAARSASMEPSPLFFTAERVARFLKNAQRPSFIDAFPIGTDDSPTVRYAQRWEASVKSALKHMEGY